MHILGLIHSMEVYRLPERRMYWQEDDVGLFKGLNYGQFVSRNRNRESIAPCKHPEPLRLSFNLLMQRMPNSRKLSLLVIFSSLMNQGLIHFTKN